MLKLDDVIGIMSDSHGRPSLIKAAARLLRAGGCTKLIHLGDICDSAVPETADECVRLLLDNGITAVKGNNDHALVVNFAGSGAPSPGTDTLDYLANLPPLIESADIAFTHSLPFFDRMGFSSLMRIIDEVNIDDFFTLTSYRLLFRGHGHSREVYSFDGVRANKLAAPAGETMVIDAALRYVITCGALVEGYCLIWNRRKETITGVKVL